MKNIFIILTPFLLINTCFGQANFTFSIKQVGLHISDYEFDGKYLMVERDSNRLEKRKLGQVEISQIDSVIKTIGLDTLKEKYWRSVFDGGYRIFNFNLNGTKKEVKLYNYYLENFDLFLREINRHLKKENRVISFGDAMLSKPDTMIYYFPDFYIDTLGLPENYNFYVTCYQRKPIVAKTLALMKMCECTIYPADKNSDYETRQLWRAFRLDNNSWKKEYLDEDNYVFKTEYIRNILPYNIVEEITHTYPGIKPSVVINRYFKTEIKEE